MTGRVQRIPRGPRSALGSALCAAATCASLFALTGLIVRGGWLVAAWLTVLVVAAVVIGVRAVTRSWWAPTLAGTIVAVGIVLVRYGAPPGRLQVLPDADSLDRTLATAREGVAVINASLVPMAGVRPTELLVVVGAVAVFLLADLVAIGLGAPALSGLAFAALWAPAIILGFPASGWSIAWTSLFYLLLLALSAAPASAHSDRGRRTGVAVLCSVSLIVATLVAGPAVAAFPGWATMSMPSFGTGPVGPMSLSDNLDLRESLGTRSGQVVLRYSVTPVEADADPAAEPAPSPSASSAAAVTANDVGPLRAFTLTTFDGNTWDRSDSLELTTWDPATLLSSDPAIRGSAPDAQRGTLADVQVEVANLRERRLPVSTFPRTVDVSGGWEYDPARDEVVGRRGTFDGMTYAMQVEIPSLTKEDLVDAEVGDPGDDGASLEVPQTTHSRRRRPLWRARSPPTPRRRTSRRWTSRRTSGRRRTSRTTPAWRPSRSDDAVWDFVQSTRGYCVQFATSMAIMARTLDIPARVGVGFLPGESDRNGSYVVSGQRSHAWPELYFEGYGWVRFEPTPAVQTSSPPRWADPFTGVSAPDSQPDELIPVPGGELDVVDGAGRAVLVDRHAGRGPGVAADRGHRRDRAGRRVARPGARPAPHAPARRPDARARLAARPAPARRPWGHLDRRRLTAHRRRVGAGAAAQDGGRAADRDVRRRPGVAGPDRRARALRPGPARVGPGRAGRVGGRDDERGRDPAQRPLSPRRRSQRSSRRDMKLCLRRAGGVDGFT